MSAEPDLAADFRLLENRLEAEPEGITGEIARGVYANSSRPAVRYLVPQGRLASFLYHPSDRASESEWLVLVMPELRSERNFSRLVPDLAGWRRSTSGWPGRDESLITLMPDWIAEVLSPSTASFDRNEKVPAYGAMGVGWLWLVDPDGKSIETFENVRGQMVARDVVTAGTVTSQPFPSAEMLLASLFL